MTRIAGTGGPVDLQIEGLFPPLSRLQIKHILEEGDTESAQRLNTLENLGAVLRSVGDEGLAVIPGYIAARLRLADACGGDFHPDDKINTSGWNTLDEDPQRCRPRTRAAVCRRSDKELHPCNAILPGNLSETVVADPNIGRLKLKSDPGPLL